MGQNGRFPLIIEIIVNMLLYCKRLNHNKYKYKYAFETSNSLQCEIESSWVGRVNDVLQVLKLDWFMVYGA